MARDPAEFAQQSGERAAQAATFGVTWAREFTEESFNQGKHALDSFLRVSRKMTEDLQSQMSAIREHTTALTEQTMANTMEFGQKLTRAKEPHEIAQCQSEFMSRQAQVIADQTKVLGQKMQRAAQDFAQTASGAMNEAARRTADAPSLVGGISSRAEQSSKKQRAEA
jgi:uncharacterized protein YoxC